MILLITDCIVTGGIQYSADLRSQNAMIISDKHKLLNLLKEALVTASTLDSNSCNSRCHESTVVFLKPHISLLSTSLSIIFRNPASLFCDQSVYGTSEQVLW